VFAPGPISKISTEDDLKDSTNTGFRNDFDIIEITDEVSGRIEIAYRLNPFDHGN
jgi:hypothetical protein